MDIPRSSEVQNPSVFGLRHSIWTPGMVWVFGMVNMALWSNYPRKIKRGE